MKNKEVLLVDSCIIESLRKHHQYIMYKDCKLQPCDGVSDSCDLGTQITDYYVLFSSIVYRLY